MFSNWLLKCTFLSEKGQIYVSFISNFHLQLQGKFLQDNQYAFMRTVSVDISNITCERKKYSKQAVSHLNCLQFLYVIHCIVFLCTVPKQVHSQTQMSSIYYSCVPFHNLNLDTILNHYVYYCVVFHRVHNYQLFLCQIPFKR